MGTDLTITVRNSTQLNEPKLYIKKIYPPFWQMYDLTSGQTTIPASFLDFEGVYEYYFNDSESLYPESGTFKIIFSAGEKNIKQLLNNFMSSEQNFGSAYCRPYQSDFTCDLENMQAAEILRFSYYWLVSKNDKIGFNFNSDSAYSNSASEPITIPHPANA